MSVPRLLASLACAALAVCASGWKAYQKNGIALHWVDRTLHYRLDAGGFKNGEMSNDAFALAATSSFATWQHAHCPASGTETGVGFVFDGWQSDAKAGLDCLDPPACTKLLPNGNHVIVVQKASEWSHGAGVIALTTVGADQDAQIGDADIELNDAAYIYTNSDLPPATIVDVSNTLTHEIGHFIGLDHSAVAGATMAPNAPPGELGKRTLATDDLDGLCAIYPPPNAPPAPGPTCASARAAPDSPVALVALVLMGLCGLAWSLLRIDQG